MAEVLEEKSWVMGMKIDLRLLFSVDLGDVQTDSSLNSHEPALSNQYRPGFSSFFSCSFNTLEEKAFFSSFFFKWL